MPAIVATALPYPPATGRRATVTGITIYRLVDGVLVEHLGRLGPGAKLAESYFARLTLKNPTPWKDIERAVLLARDIPGAQVDVRIHPYPGSAGAVELVASAPERERFDLIVLNIKKQEIWPIALTRAANLR